MEINIHFVCPCGGIVEETILCSGPNLMAERNRDSYQDSWEQKFCSGCGKDFEAHIESEIFETTVSVDGAIDLNWEIQPERDEYDDEYDLVWDIESTKQLEIYKKVTKNVVTILTMAHPLETQATLNNMLYAQVVTAVEAYLSGIFIHTVVNSEDLIRKLVESDPELAKL